MSPFCHRRTCNTAACPASTQTSAPSSCVQDVPVIRLSKIIENIVRFSEKQHTLFSCKGPITYISMTWILGLKVYINIRNNCVPQIKIWIRLPSADSIKSILYSLCFILYFTKMSHPFHQESFSQNRAFLVWIHTVQCDLGNWALPVPACSGF